MTLPPLSHQKYYLILKSTAIPRFIDHYFLGVTEKEFDKTLNDLVKAGLIWKDSLTNIYGANQYSLTMKGEEALVKQKREAIAWNRNRRTPLLFSFAHVIIWMSSKEDVNILASVGPET